MRLLANPDDATFLEKMRELDGKGLHIEKLGEEAANLQWSTVRFVDLGGDDLIFEISKRQRVEVEVEVEEVGSGDNDGVVERKEVWRRPVKKVERSRVDDLAIWSMDNLDI